MLGLQNIRYVQVPLRKITSEVVLCDPFLVQKLGGNSWAKGISNITEKFGVMTEKITPELHALTESFSPQWHTLNIGSSRSVLIEDAQVKGCGVTLSTESLHPVMKTGTLGTTEAIHSYMISHLMNLSLPLGALKGLAVLKWDDKHSLYIRNAEGFRVAQLSSELSSGEKDVLWNQVTNFHRSDDTDYIFRRIMQHYAAAVFLGISLPQSADNILIDGRFLDEEELTWPTHMGAWRITLERNDSDIKMILPFADDFRKLCTRYKSAYEFMGKKSPETTVLITWFKESVLKLWETFYPEKSEEAQSILDILFQGRDGNDLILNGFSTEVWPTIYPHQMQLIFRKHYPKPEEIHRSNWAHRFESFILEGGNSLSQSRQIHTFINKWKHSPDTSQDIKNIELHFEEGSLSCQKKSPILPRL